MGDMTTVAIVLGLTTLLLGVGTWLWSGLILASMASLWLVSGFSIDRMGAILASVVPNSAISWELAAVPLFLWMGEIIFRTDIAQRLFDGLSPLARYLPGGLLHTNILACTTFAAVSGSSAATTVTVGRITTNALADRGYSRSLASGSLAGAGTLGLLIPPSIAMIIYGVQANVSIIQLFTAGIIPGLLVALLYSGYIALRCLLDPKLAPRAEALPGIGAVLRGLGRLWSIALLIVMILGSIYTGLCTPSEAAAVGVVGAILVAVITGQFRVSMVTEALMVAVRVSCMVGIMVAAAAFMSSAISYLHLPQVISEWMNGLHLSSFGLILVLMAFYIVLGTFLEGVPIIVITLPITLPLILQAGLDPVWFGIFLIVMVEMGTISPPVGLNLFILQGLTGDSFGRTVMNALPFFVMLCVAVILMAVFPQIVLWLPSVINPSTVIPS